MIEFCLHSIVILIRNFASLYYPPTHTPQKGNKGKIPKTWFLRAIYVFAHNDCYEWFSDSRMPLETINNCQINNNNFCSMIYEVIPYMLNLGITSTLRKGLQSPTICGFLARLVSEIKNNTLGCSFMKNKMSLKDLKPQDK
ncbi:CLUMA_CG021147, isoform A [Clunio marinus]|uniref:CLUMA_CG021147, isoform A n=1 Tax=Clunio marinus TaxID=568069 RepID=A0A1J1J7A1_9DIPT|nr:CLUMA_CG021147, isoform A [Clunio marinus]